MVRNYDKLDQQLTEQIADNPGVKFSQLLKVFQMPTSTLRWRLVTLELAGEIAVEKTRNANTYYLARGRNATRNFADGHAQPLEKQNNSKVNEQNKKAVTAVNTAADIKKAI
jgi:predicted transcriptional regulator